MQFSTALLLIVGVMYAFGLLGNRSASAVERCYKEQISKPRNVTMPAKAVWDRCVDEVAQR